MDSNEIRDLFATHGVALGRKDVWDVKGKPVILHSALERLAAHLGISWDPPVVARSTPTEVVILARGTRKDGISEWSYGEVNTAKGDGEGGNYQIRGKQPGYPWAMSEKRAKDRVIIKLAGLHGAYSEEEAEDFSQRNADAPSGRQRSEEDREEGRAHEPEGSSQEPAGGDEGSSSGEPPKDEVKAARERRNTRTTSRQASKPDPEPEPDSSGPDTPEAAKLREAISKARTIDAVTNLMLEPDTQQTLNSLPVEKREELRTVAKDRLKALGWPNKGDKSAA